MARLLRGFTPYNPYTPFVDGPIVFDAVSNSGYEAALSTYNWTHTCSGLNRILIVGVGIFASGTVSSITYNGVNLTQVRSDVSGIYRCEVWYLNAPATGANTITVNLSGSLTSIGCAISYTGVEQTSSVIEANNGANGTGTSATVNITSVTDNDFTVDVVATATTSGITVGSGQRAKTMNSGALGSAAIGDRGRISPGAAVTMNWDNIGGLDAWAISTVAIRTPIVATGTVQPSFMLMGIGC